MSKIPTTNRERIKKLRELQRCTVCGKGTKNLDHLHIAIGGHIVCCQCQDKVPKKVGFTDQNKILKSPIREDRTNGNTNQV